MTTATEQLVFNGVDATTGKYLLPPCSAEELNVRLNARLGGPDEAPANPPEDDPRDILDPKRVSLVGIDTRRLDQTGWGIVYPAGVRGRIRRELEPLVTLRREQLTERSGAFHEIFLGTGESTHRLLNRLKAGRGAALRPESAPYYLLLVGGPEEIPYDVQLELNGSYAVGRIAFERPEDYGLYARRVVQHTGTRRAWSRLPRDVSFFSAHNRGDRATERLTEDLVSPLADRVEKLGSGFRVHRFLGSAASRDRLTQMFTGGRTPAFLFTASHGLGYPQGHSQQLARQGSLLCSDIDGPFVEERPVPRESFFCADDIPAESSFEGLVAFHFACYGAGTREWDTFAQARREPERRTAGRAFVARLPQRLLAHDRGALAVVGHVDRAWTTSFSWEGEESQPTAFEEMIRLLLDGQPVGASLEPLRNLWAYLSRALNETWQRGLRKEHVDQDQLTHLWTADRDVMSYVILGDPAVGLAV